MAKQTLTFTSTSNWTVPQNCYKVEVFLVGGGGGGGGGGAAGGGGGGGGGSVVWTRNVSVTPGQNISIVVGNGGNGGAIGINGSSGEASSFGTIIAQGGGGGGANNGSGGSSSRTIFGTTTNLFGSSSGGGGASPQSSADNKNGSSGYLYGDVLYAGGGGGGISIFTSGTVRPIVPGLGGKTGGGNGGGENTSGTTNDSPAQAGLANTGGGGGGGASRGESQETELLNEEPNPEPVPLKVAPETPGANGGSGIVIVTFDEATFQIIPEQPGVSEGQTITIRLLTNHVRDGISIPYTLSGTGVTQDDFNPSTLIGSFLISSADDGLTGTSTIVLTVSEDSPLLLNETEVENVTISLDNGYAVSSFAIGDFSRSPFSDVESKIISKVDYNTIQAKVASVLGNSLVSTADYGWGQPVQSSQVSESTRVRIKEWNELRFDIINAWVHLYNTTPPLVSATENNPVRANVLDAPYGQYDSYANVIVANRFGSRQPPEQFFLNPKDVSEQTWPGSAGSSWNTKLFSIIRAVWPTAQAARHFFNAGGEIRFLPTHAGGSTTDQVLAWNRLLNSIGSRSFGGAKPQSGRNPSDGLNYYRLTSGFQSWAEASASTPYSSNLFRISARSPGVQFNTNGEAISVEFQIEWIDNYTAGGGASDAVDGTFSVSISTLEPFGSLQPAGLGNFQVISPTITVVNQPQQV